MSTKRTAKADPLAELAAAVEVMRALGVTEWNGIKIRDLPPSAPKKPTREEIAARNARRQERKRDVQFAASSIKPVLPATEKTLPTVEKK